MSAEPNGLGAGAPRVSDSVVAKLAALLMEAKRGNLHAVAIAAVSPHGEPKAHWAGDSDLVASANLGLDILKTTLMAHIVRAPGATELNSGIIIAR